MASKNGKKPAAKRAKRTPKKVVVAPALKDVPPVMAHSDATRAAALRAFVEFGTVRAACKAAHVGRTAFYEWVNTDPAFARAFAEAQDDVVDELEEEALKRAKDDDTTLIIFLLKAYRRQRFGDRQTVTVMHSEVKTRVARQIEIIASQPTWDSEELLNRLGSEVWTD